MLFSLWLSGRVFHPVYLPRRIKRSQQPCRLAASRRVLMGVHTISHVRELKPHTGHKDALFLTARCLSSKRCGVGEKQGKYLVYIPFIGILRTLVW
ncbi:uncharacterized [Tachysurus ichikawai]